MRSSLALRARAELELRQRPSALRVVPSLKSYVNAANPKYVWYRHCELIRETLERVADGEIKRLMIFAPPRSGKSELVSRLFSGYYLSRFPDRFVAIASYSAELAYDLSRAARRNFTGRGELDGESTAVKHWETGKGGGLWAAGVGGPATGKGFSVGIVDDPVKNAEEAASLTIRNRNRDWWRSVFYTRQEPDAALIVMMTRWHLDDLAGWLLSEESGEEPERWTVLSLPSIAEDETPKFPATCNVIPDWREPGEALVPERFDADKLAKIRVRIGEYYWLALHQQKPRPQEGTLYKWDWFKPVRALPANASWLAYFDTAGTEGAGDYTAGALMGVDPEGRFTIADVVRGQWSPARKDSEIRAACDRWRALVGLRRIWLESEAGIGGKERTASTVRALAGYAVECERPTGSKVDRGMPFAAQCEVGNVSIVEGPWNHAFLTEMTDFPHGAHDDQHDAASGAFNKLASRPTFATTESASLIGV